MNFRFFSLPSSVNYRHLFVGLEESVPLGQGGSTIGINFDNAATTPPFVSVMEELTRFAPKYSSIHRGAGYKSIISSELYEGARREVLRFVGADLRTDTAIFVKNATEGINKLSYRLWNKGKKDVIITTWMEHHSNLLPWREKYHVEHVDIDKEGCLKLGDLMAKLEQYQGRVKLVTVSGASNVTGHMNPIYEIAKMAHHYGAKILVDGAQLVPHAPIDMRPSSSPEHIDFLVFSAHKMYAPFGTGVLIGPRAFFEQGSPEFSGGGTARLVTINQVYWEPPEQKEEAGTPNLMGVIALTAAIRTLSKIGMKKVQNYEEALVEYAFSKLSTMPGITLYGSSPTQQNKRISVITFNVDGIHHEAVAEFLSRERGIATRSGCFCAQPYVQRLLHVTKHDLQKHIHNPNLPHPGMVRASFGLYNTREEVDTFISVLGRLVHLRPRAMGYYR